MNGYRTWIGAACFVAAVVLGGAPLSGQAGASQVGEVGSTDAIVVLATDLVASSSGALIEKIRASRKMTQRAARTFIYNWPPTTFYGGLSIESLDRSQTLGLTPKAGVHYSIALLDKAGNAVLTIDEGRNLPNSLDFEIHRVGGARHILAFINSADLARLSSGGVSGASVRLAPRLWRDYTTLLSIPLDRIADGKQHDPSPVNRDWCSTLAAEIKPGKIEGLPETPAAVQEPPASPPTGYGGAARVLTRDVDFNHGEEAFGEAFSEWSATKPAASAATVAAVSKGSHAYIDATAVRVQAEGGLRDAAVLVNHLGRDFKLPVVAAPDGVTYLLGFTTDAQADLLGQRGATIMLLQRPSRVTPTGVLVAIPVAWVSGWQPSGRQLPGQLRLSFVTVKLR